MISFVTARATGAHDAILVQIASASAVSDVSSSTSLTMPYSFATSAEILAAVKTNQRVCARCGTRLMMKGRDVVGTVPSFMSFIWKAAALTARTRSQAHSKPTAALI